MENILIRSTCSTAYATHKDEYIIEPYLNHVSIKKHRTSLAKLRVSDHKLRIQSGRQTRTKTPRELRFCEYCPNKIEDEAHFLCECIADFKIKSDFLNLVSSKYPQFNELCDKNLKYKFLMKIEDPDILQSLGFCINLLFKRREEVF